MTRSVQVTTGRREFLAATAAAGAAVLAPSFQLLAAETPWKPNYMLASSMYGFTALKEIVPEVHKVGATTLDIWPKGHGNQREQLDEMGEEVFAALLKKHDVRLGCITQYKLGPFGIQEEMRLARRLGCTTIVCGGKGPRGLKGSELKAAVGLFIEQMKPHLAVAEETGVTIAIENHGSNLIETPDSLKWLVELRPSKHLAVALAPYHLPQEEKMLSDLIRALNGGIEVFYAWQYGMGCHVKLPKEEELLQMPGRGELDFAPLVEALSETGYDRWTEIFMHPVPRGIPILEPTAAVTKEINRSRTYLAKCLNAK
jgi:sugar phosphate isomerase/epimerase